MGGRPPSRMHGLILARIGLHREMDVDPSTNVTKPMYLTLESLYTRVPADLFIRTLD